MRCLVGFMFVLALGLMGCSETSSVDGRGGSSGMGGGGGTAGAAGGPIACEPLSDRCTSATATPYEACCEQTVPDQANACDGTESTENPATCAPTGNPLAYKLTLMEVEGDCSVGYDLDDCDGTSCLPSYYPPPADGMSGVDNALAGYAAFIEPVGEDFLRVVNKELAGMLCGTTTDSFSGTCHGGVNDGRLCTGKVDCPGADARCQVFEDDCMVEIVPTEIRFLIDTNAGEGCANVTVLADGEASAHVLNLSDDGCVSGTLGTIPITIGQGRFATDGFLKNAVVRMTVSPAGFSHGKLGVAIDENITSAIVHLIGDGLPIVLDINASSPPTRDTSARCNAATATLLIGGVAE